jgi:hypothetical protein
VGTRHTGGIFPRNIPRRNIPSQSPLFANTRNFALAGLEAAVSDEIKGSGNFQISGAGTLRGVGFLLVGILIGSVIFLVMNHKNKNVKVTIVYEESEKPIQPQLERADVIPTPKEEKKPEQEPQRPDARKRETTQKPKRSPIPYYYVYPRELDGYSDTRRKKFCVPGFNMPEVCYLPQSNQRNIRVHPTD